MKNDTITNSEYVGVLRRFNIPSEVLREVLKELPSEYDDGLKHPLTRTRFYKALNVILTSRELL